MIARRPARGPRPVVALVFACLALRAGAAEGATPRRVHLLDLTGDLPPRLEIGGVQQPVLAFDPAGQATIGGTETKVPPSRTIEVTLALPAGWSSDQLIASALVVVDGVPRWQPPTLQRTTPPVAVFQFRGKEVGRSVRLIVVGSSQPKPGPRRRTLGPVTVAPGSHLRVAIGVPAGACKFAPPTVVRVDAIQGRRSRAVLHRRLDQMSPCDQWIPFDIALAGVAGPDLRFRFRMRARRKYHAGRVLAATIGDPIVEAPASASPPPNVILISLDTLGAKHLGAYGYPFPTSPNLDALVPTGTLFEHVVAAYPSTAASHMTLFTGRLPASHGVRGYLDVLAPVVPTLPQALRAAGYLNAAFTEDATLAVSMGFGRGFHEYRENRSATTWGTTGRVRQTLGDARRWLDTAPGDPFFLFIHTYQVHTPYTPPPSHALAVRPDEPCDPKAPPVRLYDGEVHYLDERLARFLRYLSTRRFLERTLVIITADHGESFGEHGHQAHGHCLHEEAMQVPLLVLGPGITPGRRVADRIGLVDLAPTILDLAGVPPLPDADGRSVVPALRGAPLEARPLVAELEGPLGPMGGTPSPNQRAVWVGDHKVIHDLENGMWWFTDLAHDPDETAVTSLPPIEVLATMKERLEWYHTLTPVAGQGIVGEGTITPAAIEKLRALGYVE